MFKDLNDFIGIPSQSTTQALPNHYYHYFPLLPFYFYLLIFIFYLLFYLFYLLMFYLFFIRFATFGLKTCARLRLQALQGLCVARLRLHGVCVCVARLRLRGIEAMLKAFLEARFAYISTRAQSGISADVFESLGAKVVSVLQTKLTEYPLTMPEASTITALLQTAPLTEKDRDACMDLLDSPQELRLAPASDTPSTDSVLSTPSDQGRGTDFKVVEPFVKESLRVVLADARLHPTQKLHAIGEMLCDFEIKMLNEKSYALCVALLIASQENVTEEMIEAAGGPPGLDLVRQLKEFHILAGGRMTDLKTVVMPNSPAELWRTNPELYNKVYKDEGPSDNRVEGLTHARLRAAVPCRRSKGTVAEANWSATHTRSSLPRAPILQPPLLNHCPPSDPSQPLALPSASAPRAPTQDQQPQGASVPPLPCGQPLGKATAPELPALSPVRTPQGEQLHQASAPTPPGQVLPAPQGQQLQQASTPLPLPPPQGGQLQASAPLPQSLPAPQKAELLAPTAPPRPEASTVALPPTLAASPPPDAKFEARCADAGQKAFGLREMLQNAKGKTQIKKVATAIGNNLKRKTKVSRI